MAGLLGSGHCFAMCGGIAGALGALMPLGQSRRSRAAVLLQALQFNLGRLTGYALAGALLAGMVGAIPKLPGLEFLGIGLRLLTATLVAMIGLRYAFDWNGLNRIEQWGARLWPKISPMAVRLARSPGSRSRLLLGLCWGFLPCGLVYTLLLTAAASGHAVTGAAVMLAFGLGTLPSMLGLTLAAPALAGILKDREVRRFIGFSLVLLAAWMAFSLFSMNSGSPTHQH